MCIVNVDPKPTRKCGVGYKIAGRRGRTELGSISC